MNELFRQTLLSFAIGIIAAFLLSWIWRELWRDSNIRRRQIARGLLKLASDFDAAETSGREAILRILQRESQSPDRFTKCYSAYVAGQIGRTLSDAPRQIETIVDLLVNLLGKTDPFVRHAAAAALYHLGANARGARSALEQTSQQFEEESSGRIAKRLLQHLGDSLAQW